MATVIDPGAPRPDDERFALALEAGRMGTWQWDLASGVLHWDLPLMRLFGTSPEQFDGTFAGYLALLHPDDRDHVVEVLERAVEQRSESDVEHRLQLADGRVRWISGTGRVLLDADNQPVGMVGVAADVTERKHAEQRLMFLARAGELLGSSLDLDTTLQQLCDLAVERLADWCTVDLIEGDLRDGAGVRQVAVAHRDPDKVAYARNLRARFGVDMDADVGLPVVLRTGRPEVLPELPEVFLRPLLEALPGITPEDITTFLALGLRSSVCVPLTAATAGVIGALTLVAGDSGVVFDDDDVALAVEVAGRAATAVENARLYASAVHASRTLQQSLLPPVLPPVPFAEVAAYYAPADESDVIGGDFYDVWPTPSGGLCMVVGDVSGKGVDAAALTGECRWTLRSSLTRSGSPSEALEELNSAMLLQERDRFVTVVAAVLEPAEHGVQLSYASAGHPAPLVRRADGSAELLETDGQIVGVLPGPVARLGTAMLRQGDALVLYSDGFSEARRDADLFGDEGMLNAVRSAEPGTDAEGLVDLLVEAVRELGHQRDDRAMLVARMCRPGGGTPGTRHGDDARPTAPDDLLIEVGPRLDTIPAGRHFARQALSGRVPGGVVEDVELVVTELLTNAVLHGLPPATLRVHADVEQGTARVEVQDSGRLLPVRQHVGGEGLTGRGLGLVAALSTAWGVEALKEGGKVVWADVGADGEQASEEPQLDLDALLDAWLDEDDQVFTIELGDVPTDLLLAAKAHVDNLTREFALVTSMAAEESRLTPRLAAVVQTVEHEFADARNQIKRQAVQAAERGQAVAHLVLRLPASAADAGERYLTALDDADRYARDARLLTLETPAAHRVFRQWYVRGLVDQLRAAALGEDLPRVATFAERLADEVGVLSESRDAVTRLSLLQRVTIALTAARTVEDIAAALVDSATTMLDAASAAIYLLQDDGMLEQIGVSRGLPEVAGEYAGFPAAADLPGGVALRTGESVILRGRAQFAERFPALADLYVEERTLMVAPLLLPDRPLGVFAMSFHGASTLDEGTQIAFLTTLAAVTTQAMERALAAPRGA